VKARLCVAVGGILQHQKLRVEKNLLRFRHRDAMLFFVLAGIPVVPVKACLLIDSE
jgi:hypothetical protein